MTLATTVRLHYRDGPRIPHRRLREPHPEGRMTPEFADIRIIGLDEELTTRADPTEVLYDVHFVLSTETPVRWGQLFQARLGTRGVAGRRAWPQRKYLVVRCAIDEVERVLTALRPMLEAVNREYRVWATAQEGARAEEEAFDRREREKLRDVKARLEFG